MVAYIPTDAHVEGHGFRVALVVEGEDGYRPTGTWPYEGKPGQQMPWFWGDTYDQACTFARDYNAQRGIDAETASEIVAHSMALGR